jgi:hypothetical protein
MEQIKELIHHIKHRDHTARIHLNEKIKPTASFCSLLVEELNNNGIRVKHITIEYESKYEYEGELGPWGREVIHKYIKLWF